jgi:FHS family glucose/mannose:H+ symporter-like MFS transporter
MGSVLEELLQHFHRDYSDGGQLIFAQFAGFLIGVLTAPLWSKRLGRRGLILLAFGTLTVGEAVYSFLPSWNWMMTAAPVAGFGFGTVEAAIGALVMEYFKENKAIAMSRLEVFFGIGAFVMPLTGSLLISMGAWKMSFPILTVLSLAMLLLWSFTSFGSMNAILAKPDTSQEAASSEAYERAPGRGLPVLLFMLVFFVIYVGIEMSLVNFLPSVLIEHTGTSSALGTLGVTFFWMAMVVGRLFSGVLAEKWGYGRYLLITGFGSLLFLAILPFMTGLAESYIIILLLGLLMAGIFAMALVFTTHVLPGTEERTTSLLIAAGGLGGALLPLLTGEIMDRYRSVFTIWTLAALMAIMMAMLLFAIRHSRRLI